MNRSGTRLALLILLICLGQSTSSMLGQCPDPNCLSTQKPGWTLNSFSVAFGSSGFSDADRAAIAAGFEYWNSIYPGMFFIVGDGPAQVTLVVDESLRDTDFPAAREQTGPNGGSVIGYNPKFLNKNKNAFLRHVSGHEAGHAQGFNHVHGNCSGVSIMYGNISEFGPFLSSPTACDITAVNDSAPSGGGGGGSGGGGDENVMEPCHIDCSPLVLDLDGGGIYTTGTDRPVWFDIDGDGIKDLVTWTDPTTSEAFLWLDLNRNGAVDGGAELFGIATRLPDGTLASDGFAALAAYDTTTAGGNGDGKIDHLDRIWGRLLLWIDSNHDGVSQRHEVGPIHGWGVRELYLYAVEDSVPDENGNVHILRGTYLRQVLQHGPPSYELRALDDILFRRVTID